MANVWRKFDEFDCGSSCVAEMALPYSNPQCPKTHIGSEDRERTFFSNVVVLFKGLYNLQRHSKVYWHNPSRFSRESTCLAAIQFSHQN